MTRGALMAKIAKNDVTFPVGHQITDQCLDIITRLLEKDESARLGAEESDEVKRHPWFGAMDFDALYRKEINPVFVPEAIPEDPLAHFPDKLTEQVVDKADFQSAAGSAISRAPSKEDFAVSDQPSLCYD